MKITRILLLLLISNFFSNIYAKPLFESGLNYVSVYPVNSYKNDFGGWRNGLNGFLGYNLPIVPLTIGVSADYYWFGSSENPDTYYNRVNVENSYKKLLIGTYAKLQFRHGKFQPYFTGHLSNQTLSSSISHSLKKRDYYGYEYNSNYDLDLNIEITSNGNTINAQYQVSSSDDPIQQKNKTLIWGIGAGMQIKIYDNSETIYDESLYEIKKGIINRILVDVGLYYFTGSDINYLTGDTFIKINDEYLFDKSASFPQFITLRCGMAVSLF